MSKPTSDRDGVIQVIQALQADGYTLARVFDGEESTPVTTELEALDAIFAVDDAFMYVNIPDSTREGWVRFVLGNDPEEVVCDYTLSLDQTLEPLTEGWWD